MIALSEKDRLVLLESMQETNYFWLSEIRRTLTLYPNYAQDLKEKQRVLERLMREISQ